MCLLPRLQCSHELLEFPLAQRPVEFYVGRVQFELKEPRFFPLGFAASKPPVFPTSEFGKREAAGHCPGGVSGSPAQADRPAAPLEPLLLWECVAATSVPNL